MARSSLIKISGNVTAMRKILGDDFHHRFPLELFPSVPPCP
jgi:hypothetical protein